MCRPPCVLPYRSRAGLALALLSACMLLTANPAAATTYFVRSSGDDSQDGLTPETARATIATTAFLLAEPGDRLVVGPGEYFESNIRPIADGTRDLPIVLHGDASGEFTGDPAGPVVIRPSNSGDDRAGITLFGRHDFVIEGFTILSGADAGIQVRPDPISDVDSTRVLIRNNEIRDSLQRGIDISAAGDVWVADNYVFSTELGAGIRVLGGARLPARPHISGNTLEGNFGGIAVEDADGGEIANNRIHDSVRGISVLASTGVEIAGNDVQDCQERPLLVGNFDRGPSSAITVVHNTLDAQRESADFLIAGDVEVRDNLIVPENGYKIGLSLRAVAPGTATIDGNRTAGMWIADADGLVFTDNRLDWFAAEKAGAAVATGNVVTRNFNLIADGSLDLHNNTANSILAAGRKVDIRDNVAETSLSIDAGEGTFVGNRSNRFSLRGRHVESPPTDGPLTFSIEDATVTGSTTLGAILEQSSHIEVKASRFGGTVVIRAHPLVDVQNVSARGVEVQSNGGGGRVVVRDSTFTNGRDYGLLVDRAGDVRVEGVTVLHSTGTGISIDNAATVHLEGNEIRESRREGIQVNGRATVRGDCDSDRSVTVNEVIVAVGIALGTSTIDACTPADTDSDGSVTVNDLTIAVSVALGTLPPYDEAARTATVTLAENIVGGSGRGAVIVHTAGSAAIVGNRILESGGVGIYARAESLDSSVSVLGNVVSGHEDEGIVAGGSDAILIEGNRVFSNGTEGIVVRDCPGAAVVNNLSYANGGHGIGFGRGSTIPSPGGLMMNNTLHGNARWGFTLGTVGASAPNTTVLNNILSGNRRGGAAAEEGSFPGLTIAFNLNNDGYSEGVVASVTDFTADPRWVSPAGADGILGGAGWEDDDFHLQSTPIPSAAIDAGSDTAAALQLGGSAVAGVSEDAGVVDLGFHYPVDTD